ncbi:unnamed protein product [Tenebrio molitor]|nr:unnamed protein product [Tenebrio molitor]
MKNSVTLILFLQVSLIFLYYFFKWILKFYSRVANFLKINYILNRLNLVRYTLV